MRKIWIFVIVLVLALAACNGDDDNGGGGQNGGSGGDSGGAQATPITPSPLPPTWTPGVRASVTPMATRPPVDDSASQNLPTAPPPGPTWTPFPEVCDQLAVVEEGTSVNVTTGTSASLSWTPVEGIANYRVDMQFNGSEIFNQITTNTALQIPGEVFISEGVYGWQVTPVNESGEQICSSISGEFIASAPLGGTSG